MNNFDPQHHSLVAVVTNPARPDYGEHQHVSLTEIRSDLADLAVADRSPPPLPETSHGDARLPHALALAAVAAAMQVEAGDYRWHGGSSDFVWTDQAGVARVMDAYDFITFAKAVFNGG